LTHAIRRGPANARPGTGQLIRQPGTPSIDPRRRHPLAPTGAPAGDQIIGRGGRQKDLLCIPHFGDRTDLRARQAKQGDGEQQPRDQDFDQCRTLLPGPITDPRCVP